MTTLKYLIPRFHLLPLLLLLLPRSAAAQTEICKDCPCLIARGERLAAAGDYVNAIRQYNAAKECAPERTAELNRHIEALFQRIEGLRQEAEKAKEEAWKQKTKAEKNLKRAERAERSAKVEARRAEESAREAEAEKSRAEAEAQRAKKALQKLQKATGIYVKQANDFIFQLEYDSATVRAAEASKLQELDPAPALAALYLELAYFFNEAGRPDRAAAMTDSLLARLDKPSTLNNKTIHRPRNPTRDSLRALGPQPSAVYRPPSAVITRDSLRTLLSTLDSDAFEALEKKYYPHILPIPGGTFMMGSKQYGLEFKKEQPIHEVTLNPFGMAETETTWWQYYLYCQSSGRSLSEAPIWGRQGSHPVVNVSWKDAQAYIQWLNDRMPATFRLPTEAEWEYAARAGQDFPYAGSDDLNEVAWYREGSGERAHPVKDKKPNGWDLYDLSGNVWEWCQDWYNSYPSSPQAPPQGSESHSCRVLRGGSWRSWPASARVAYRYRNVPGYRDVVVGFRVARP